MTLPLLPAFNIHGVMPPVRPGQDGASGERSPYRVDLLTFCQHFGVSSPRRSILRGLLELRSQLAAAGKQEGFQWINGSFTEDVEGQHNRAPNDVDVVTFISFGDAAAKMDLLQNFQDLVNPQRSKLRFKVDHYLVPTDVPLTIEYAQTLAYWSSLWSHRRGDNRWKGFVAVPLASNDADARAWLEQADGATDPGGETP
jgi:hypothetical protein